MLMGVGSAFKRLSRHRLLAVSVTFTDQKLCEAQNPPSLKQKGQDQV